jgi:hypothetical protein
MLSILIGVLSVLAVAGLCAHFPAVSRAVAVVNGAGLFLLVALFGLAMIGDRLLSILR